MSTTTDTGHTPADRRRIFFIALVTSFLTPFMGSSINIALPAIGSELGADAVLLSWIPTSFVLASAIFLIPMGRLADIHGMRRVFVPGIIIFTAGTLLCAFSWSTPLLIGFRLIQGIGNAMMFSTAIAALTAVYPPGERGAVLGINVAVTYIGLSAGPVLGGIITQNFGWRSIFYAVIPCGVFIIYLLLSSRDEWMERSPGKFDTAGSVMYGLLLLSLMYGLSLFPGPESLFFIACCVPLVIILVFRETRTDSPLFDISLFWHNHVFAFSNIATVINYCATFAVGFLLALYLQFNRGLDPQSAGIILVAQPVVQAVFSPAAGRLSDRIEPGIVASAGMGVTAVGLFCLALLTETTPVFFIIAALAVLGLGFALFSSPNTNAIMSSVSRDCLGIASATVGTARQVGMMLSLGIVMMIFSVIIGRVRISPENHLQLMASVQIAFGIFAVLCVAGIYFSMARGKIRKREDASGER